MARLHFYMLLLLPVKLMMDSGLKVDLYAAVRDEDVFCEAIFMGHFAKSVHGVL